MELERRQTSELQALSEDYKRSLTELQDRLITLPDIEDELARRRAERQAADPAGKFVSALRLSASDEADHPARSVEDNPITSIAAP